MIQKFDLVRSRLDESMDEENLTKEAQFSTNAQRRCISSFHHLNEKQEMRMVIKIIHLQFPYGIERERDTHTPGRADHK